MDSGDTNRRGQSDIDPILDKMKHNNFLYVSSRNFDLSAKIATT